MCQSHRLKPSVISSGPRGAVKIIPSKSNKGKVLGSGSAAVTSDGDRPLAWGWMLLRKELGKPRRADSSFLLLKAPQSSSGMWGLPGQHGPGGGFAPELRALQGSSTGHSTACCALRRQADPGFVNFIFFSFVCFSKGGLAADNALWRSRLTPGRSRAVCSPRLS